jgi:hypothetical protein
MEGRAAVNPGLLKTRANIANSYRSNYLAGLTGASANAGGRALVVDTRVHAAFGERCRLVGLGPVHGRP